MARVCFERGHTIFGVSVAMLRGACGFWAVSGVVAAVLGQRGKFLPLVAARAVRSGLFPWVRVGSIFVRVGPFRGFFGTISAIFILVGGIPDIS